MQGILVAISESVRTVADVNTDNSGTEKEQESALDASIRKWRADSMQDAFNSVASFHKSIEEEAGILWPQVYRILDAKLEKAGIKPGAFVLKSAFMSSQSQAGNFCEDLMVAFGEGCLQDGGFSYRTLSPKQFKREVTSLRKCIGEDPDTKSAAVRRLSSEYMVTAKYAEKLLTPPKGGNKYPSITYPDLAFHVFEEDWETLYVCEQKLSGDNDSKAVTKNLDVLADLKDSFHISAKGEVKSVVLLPCSSEKLKVRWVSGREQNPADMVLYNEEIFRDLFRVEGYKKTYGKFLHELANITAEVLFGKLSPAGSTPEVSDTGEITWSNPEEALEEAPEEAGTAD